MSRVVNLFVDAPENLADFVSDLQSLFGVKFDQISKGGELWYEFQNAYLNITIAYHEYENDGELKFENYLYEISFREKYVDEKSNLYTISTETALNYFDRLLLERHYKIMLVDDLQKKIKEFPLSH